MMFEKFLLSCMTFMVITSTLSCVNNDTSVAQEEEKVKWTYPSPKDLKVNSTLPDNTKQPNILFLIADDMGIETLRSYKIGEDPAFTPNLDKLAANGIQVNRFWADPICSPTRAAILTGRSGLQTGVTAPIYQRWSILGYEALEKSEGDPYELEAHPPGWVDPGIDITANPKPAIHTKIFGNRTFGLPTDEVILPNVLKALPKAYSTAAFGKWHLCELDNGDLTHPNKIGFDHYEGVYFGMPFSHFKWRNVVNGKVIIQEGYADEHYTNSAISFIQSQKESPWMVWMSYINPHTPLHVPPDHLLESEKAKNLDEKNLTKKNRRPFFNAQIEAMDALIGKLLSAMPPDVRDNTYIIFLGDNGTAKWSQPSPPITEERVKGTAYTGGVEVPLFISGPNLSKGKEIEPVAHVTDLFPTALELAGINYESEVPITGVSMAPYLKGEDHPAPRQTVYSYTLVGGKNFGIKNHQYKLTIQKGKEEFFDYQKDLLELAPLDIEELEGEALANYNLLKEESKKIGYN